MNETLAASPSVDLEIETLVAAISTNGIFLAAPSKVLRLAPSVKLLRVSLYRSQMRNMEIILRHGE